MSRRFTHAEAEGLLPEVERSLREAIGQKRRYDEAEEAIRSVTQRVAMAGGSVVDREAILEERARRDASGARLKEAVEEIQALGVLIKDLDIGLIDFPTLFRGREVYLCWKFGERGIRYWHGVDEGYRGRKEIDRDFLDNHEGEPLH
jgi:hypothetical protein